MLDRFSSEKEMRKIIRLMADQKFANKAEADEFLREMVDQGPLPDLPPETPLEKAQELAYAAYAAEGEERFRLARQALEITPDCADAWLILADEAPTDEDVGEDAGGNTADDAGEDAGDDAGEDRYFERLREAVRAGERALGPEIFDKAAGHFWGLLETRPYMRARWTLAQALWHGDQLAEACSHGQELLRLNESDNQGVRYLLLHWLLEAGDDGAAADLFERFDENTALWLFGGALLRLRQGRDAVARTMLHQGVQENPYITLVLTEIMREERAPSLPTTADSVTVGQRDEAEAYWHGALAAWLKTDGALPWLMRQLLDLSSRPWAGRRVGRNDPCPCGSGKKYKRCCG